MKLLSFDTLAIGVCIKLAKMHHLLIALARGFKLFDDVEPIYGGDEDQVCLKYMKSSQINDKPQNLCTWSEQLKLN